MTFEEIVLADQNEYQNETCCVIEEQQSIDGVAIMTYKEIKRTGIQNPVLFTGTFEECSQWSSQYTWDNPYCSEVSQQEEYTEVDDTWPSRRWNKDHSDFIDLSGHEIL